MGLVKIFLSLFSLAFRALESVGILWDIHNQASEYIYGKHGVAVREPLNPVVKLSACGIVQSIKERKLKCREIIQAFIDRIHEVNPLLNAVVGDRFEEALEEARHIDEILDSCDADSYEEKSILLNKTFAWCSYDCERITCMQGIRSLSWARGSERHDCFQRRGCC